MYEFGEDMYIQSVTLWVTFSRVILVIGTLIAVQEE